DGRGLRDLAFEVRRLLVEPEMSHGLLFGDELHQPALMCVRSRPGGPGGPGSPFLPGAPSLPSRPRLTARVQASDSPGLLVVSVLQCQRLPAQVTQSPRA